MHFLSVEMSQVFFSQLDTLISTIYWLQIIYSTLWLLITVTKWDGGLQPLYTHFLSYGQRECQNLHFYDTITVLGMSSGKSRGLYLYHRRDGLFRFTEGHCVYSVIIGPCVFIISYIWKKNTTTIKSDTRKSCQLKWIHFTNKSLIFLTPSACGC